MLETDLSELKFGVYEAFSELFSNEVYYYDLVPPSTTNIYNEVKDKDYSPPMQITAKVVLNPDKEKLSLIGQNNMVDSTFEVPLYCLEKIDVADKKIGEMKKAKIVFRDIDYLVMNVVPNTNIGEVFLTYLFECRGEEIE